MIACRREAPLFEAILELKIIALIVSVRVDQMRNIEMHIQLCQLCMQREFSAEVVESKNRIINAYIPAHI